ncbi:MAG: decarboxylating NADP(+)-dependent phosphogluconate dehydrogenase [Bacteroidaceae bacterium]|nr:decarboxylating NADP(+)-dependent phosphogluconate dehydrogenase [Bacteroidaceae bacterium]
MKKQTKTQIGLIGLGVMGKNLALNLANNGWSVSVYNRDEKGLQHIAEDFVQVQHKDGMQGYSDLVQFTASIDRPRKIMLMVPAGKPVDELIEKLSPLLDPNDIIIDGGNSNFEDTNQRVIRMESKGFYFIGAGISGGEEGALNGASIMPGGSIKAWEEVKPILQSIAAKAEDGTPCCEWIGTAGSGHFVKMIHNGIEYGDMQLIAEAYWGMKELAGMSNEEMSATFTAWNNGKLQSYLIEITAHILKHKSKDNTYLIDQILDVSGQKGTGRWTVTNAMELGMPLGLIATAVFQRNLSAQKDTRKKAANMYISNKRDGIRDKKDFIEQLSSALYASKLMSYAQGFAVLKQASDTYHWDLDLASIAKLWRGGCIIRSKFLNDIADAFSSNPELPNLLLSAYFKQEVETLIDGWKSVVIDALQNDCAMPAFSSALNYFLAFTSEELPANMIQAQRDYFGAHTFELKREKRGQFYHENWNTTNE